MILVDANLLLYAYDPRAREHERSRAWLEAVLSGPDLVRFAWGDGLGFSENRDQSASVRATPAETNGTSCGNSR